MRVVATWRSQLTGSQMLVSTGICPFILSVLPQQRPAVDPMRDSSTFV